MRGTPGAGRCNWPRRRFIPAHAGNTCPGARRSGCRPVHPRACGEHAAMAMMMTISIGSSPRMRGTRTSRVSSACTIRFIPAHAGNTSTRPMLPNWYSVHPRACGEHDYNFPADQKPVGSSPRMRGTPGQTHQANGQRRFIPAHAGNTWPPAPKPSAATVHPRACGEHSPCSPPPRPMTGSSPRMRGTPPGPLYFAVGVRFIPAHAGNTGRVEVGCQRSPVHPRACGEHTISHPDHPGQFGSSPRMRGTRFNKHDKFFFFRFIPAHAGNTPKASRWAVPSSVHPRACGEHVGHRRGGAECRGSSPRMRGTLTVTATDIVGSRFIPAHAGNTSAMPLRPAEMAVHPRACGEHAMRASFSSTMAGSSPRMRGTPADILRK